MSLTPEQLQKMIKPVTTLYSELEEELLKNVARKLSKHKDLLTEDSITDWQRMKLSQLNELSRDNVKTLAMYSDKSQKEMIKLLSEAGFENIVDTEKTLNTALNRGELPVNQVVPFRESQSLLEIITAYTSQATNRLNITNTVMLDMTTDRVYMDILERTTGEVISGISTPREALRKTVSEWSQKGVPALIDKAGKEWGAEGYINMITRTMTNQVANDMQNERIQEYGVDLIEVSSHIGARPRCAEYQGDVYSLSGTHPKYRAFSSTSYGEAAGLFGINCGHQQYPFWEGKSTQTYKGYDKERNEKAYKNSQTQRKLERDIRKAKREKTVMMEMKDGQGVHFAEEKIRDKQKDMRTFINKTGRTRRSGREQLR